MKTNTNKKIRFFLKKHFYKVRMFTIILGTLIMFYGFYFSDKSFTVETFIENGKNPMMYLCILFAFATSILIHYVIGDFNKENKNKKSNYPNFKFFSKKKFYLFRVFNIIMITTFVYCIFYYFANTLIFPKGFNENKLIISINLIIGFGISLLVNYFIGFFNKENIKKITSIKEFEE